MILNGLELAVEIFDVLILGDNTIGIGIKVETGSIRRDYNSYGTVVWTYICTLVFLFFLMEIYRHVPQRLCQLCSGNDVSFFSYLWGKVVT